MFFIANKLNYPAPGTGGIMVPHSNSTNAPVLLFSSGVMDTRGFVIEHFYMLFTISLPFVIIFRIA
jgi:hypothetical protein